MHTLVFQHCAYTLILVLLGWPYLGCQFHFGRSESQLTHILLAALLCVPLRFLYCLWLTCIIINMWENFQCPVCSATFSLICLLEFSFFIWNFSALLRIFFLLAILVNYIYCHEKFVFMSKSVFISLWFMNFCLTK